MGTAPLNWKLRCRSNAQKDAQIGFRSKIWVRADWANPDARDEFVTIQLISGLGLEAIWMKIGKFSEGICIDSVNPQRPTKVLSLALLLDIVTYIDRAYRYPDVSASVPHIPIVCGAHSGLPSILSMLIVFKAASMDGLSTYFVRTSAQFFVPSTFLSSI